ncbi:MAG: MFS transporter [Deltaproteobacteria bacterium]|nr:MFS transporter [Deltaproteobacteria bacterium]MBW2393059.1 MFS transporter [Deltaproteobacteria bacterium]
MVSSFHPPRISIARLTAYGGPAFGLGYLLFFLQFYFLKFATDVLLLAPAVIGVAMTVAKLWDAISDPLVGTWSDRTRSPLGRRRPWMFAGLPVMLLGFVALWTPPAGMPPAAVTAFCFVSLLVFYTGFTLYSVPHGSWGAELSDDPHQRTRAFALRQASWTIGLLLAFGAIQFARGLPAPAHDTALLALATGAAAVIFLALTPLLLREPAKNSSRGGAGFRAAWRDVMRSRHARILLLVWFIENLGVGVLGGLAPFVIEYSLGRPDLMGVLPGVYVVAGVISLPVWVMAARRFGKHATWLVSMGAGGAGFGATFFVGEGQIVAMAVALAIAGAGMGCGGALSSAVLADVIDADAVRTGERKEGTYTAALNFALKAGIAFSTGGVGVALGLIGFEPNAVQAESTVLALRQLFAGIPAVGFAIGALVFWRFDLPATRRTTGA